jgi:hypothetical protein
VAADRPVDWLISASPMAARRWLAKPSWMLRVRPSRASSLAWARSPGYDAIVIVEPLDRLIGLSEALGVIAPDRFGNVMHAIRPEEEAPAENVPAGADTSALSHQPFLLPITWLTVGLGFNKFKGLARLQERLFLLDVTMPRLHLRALL